MPTLHCTNDNNDPNSKVSLEFNLLETITIDKASWLNYEIIFRIGQEAYKFSSKNRKAITALGTVGEIGKFALSIAPYNELESFTKGLQSFLDSNTQSYRFEPADPSFELILERTIDPNEIKVYCWIDAGNTQQLVYTWDGLGLRFVTSRVSIEEFILLLTNSHQPQCPLSMEP
jgi:hypothetical protein